MALSAEELEETAAVRRPEDSGGEIGWKSQVVSQGSGNTCSLGPLGTDCQVAVTPNVTATAQG